MEAINELKKKKGQGIDGGPYLWKVGLCDKVEFWSHCRRFEVSVLVGSATKAQIKFGIYIYWVIILFEECHLGYSIIFFLNVEIIYFFKSSFIDNYCKKLDKSETI